MQIWAIGRIKSPFQEVADLYLERIQKRLPFEIKEIEIKGLVDQEKEQNLKENQAFLSRMEKASNRQVFIGLDPSGRKIDSPQFASLIAGWRDKGNTPVFLIGGSHGLNQEVKKKCECLISFSDLVFPHLLFRTLLLEQIYRSLCIIHGEKYHK